MRCRNLAPAYISLSASIGKGKQQDRKEELEDALIVPKVHPEGAQDGSDYGVAEPVALHVHPPKTHHRRQHIVVPRAPKYESVGAAEIRRASRVTTGKRGLLALPFPQIEVPADPGHVRRPRSLRGVLDRHDDDAEEHHRARKQMQPHEPRNEQPIVQFEQLRRRQAALLALRLQVAEDALGVEEGKEDDDWDLEEALPSIAEPCAEV